MENLPLLMASVSLGVVYWLFKQPRKGESLQKDTDHTAVVPDFVTGPRTNVITGQYGMPPTLVHEYNQRFVDY